VYRIIVTCNSKPGRRGPRGRPNEWVLKQSEKNSPRACLVVSGSTGWDAASSERGRAASLLLLLLLLFAASGVELLGRVSPSRLPAHDGEVQQFLFLGGWSA